MNIKIVQNAQILIIQFSQKAIDHLESQYPSVKNLSGRDRTHSFILLIDSPKLFFHFVSFKYILSIKRIQAQN